MTKKTFTTAYNRTEKCIRDCSTVSFTKPSMVKSSLAYATDINKIYEQYCNTGRLPLNGKQPIYDENFVKYDSLIDAQKIIAQASEYFLGLPAKIKNQYGNSLESFIKALNSKDEFLVKEGLLQLKTEVPSVLEKENISDSDVNIDVPPVDTNIQTNVNTAPTE